MAEEQTYLVAFTLDFETGGLDCRTSACTQIAIHATRLDTFEKLGAYKAYILPYNKKELKGTPRQRKVLKNKFDIEEPKQMEYTDRALEYSAITMDMLYEQGKPLETVAAETLQFIKDNTPRCAKNMKPFIIGQNIGFDEGFLCQMFEYAGLMGELKKCLRGAEDFYGQWHPLTLDTILLGQLALCHIPEVNSYKLELMCEKLEIDLDDAHDADADVAATTNVAAVLTQRMRTKHNGDEEDGATTLAISKTEKSRKYFKI